MTSSIDTIVQEARDQLKQVMQSLEDYIRSGSASVIPSTHPTIDWWFTVYVNSAEREAVIIIEKLYGMYENREQLRFAYEKTEPLKGTNPLILDIARAYADLQDHQNYQSAPSVDPAGRVDLNVAD